MSHHTPSLAADRTRSEESWVEIASQPSSSSLSSAAGDIVTTGLRVQHDAAARRRRRQRTIIATSAPLQPGQSGTLGDASSQEEYEESESESDRVMTSSSEGLVIGGHTIKQDAGEGTSDDDENRTAVNYPIPRRSRAGFTPQPNAFTHPPASATMRHASEPCPGSYFPQIPARSTTRPNVRHSSSTQDHRVQHSPYNALSPAHNAAAHHDAALRASLSTLLSCAAAARGLTKTTPAQPAVPTRSSERAQPNTFRLVPESALPGAPKPRQSLEPDFQPTIRQHSSASTSTSADARLASSIEHEHKRKGGRGTSKERRSSKKARRCASPAGSYGGGDDVFVSPTLLTWIVSAGVVVVLSAISFSAGYSIGREAGKVEASSLGSVGGDVGSCASDAGRAGLGVRRLRFAVMA